MNETHQTQSFYPSPSTLKDNNKVGKLMQTYKSPYEIEENKLVNIFFGNLQTNENKPIEKKKKSVTFVLNEPTKNPCLNKVDLLNEILSKENEKTFSERHALTSNLDVRAVSNNDDSNSWGRLDIWR